jgi:hypothetical protein
VKPHYEIIDIRELQPGQSLRGAGRGAMAFSSIRGGWNGIATGYLLVRWKSTICVQDKYEGMVE